MKPRLILQLCLLVVSAWGQQTFLDTTNKNAVIAFYNTQYKVAAATAPLLNWTGNGATCAVGTTNVDYRSAVIQRVNFFRVMAGMPPVILDNTASQTAEATALIMAANNTITHTPPATYTCYSADGANGASNSNLALGYATGWDAVEGYINEDTPLGHRRWVIFPPEKSMGTGDVPGINGGQQTNALWVTAGQDWSAAVRPQVRDNQNGTGFTAWPPPGYVPYRFAYPAWSISVPGADFSQSTVTITDVTQQQPVQAPVQTLDNGYGDNTLMFKPANAQMPKRPPVGTDLPFDVAVNSVMVNGAAQNFSYRVILIDTNDPPSDITLDPQIWGAGDIPAGSQIGTLGAVDNPGTDPTTFVFTLVPGDGATDNASFQIMGATLNSAAILPYTQLSFSIRVRVNNGRPNGLFEKVLTIKPWGM